MITCILFYPIYLSIHLSIITATLPRKDYVQELLNFILILNFLLTLSDIYV